MNQNAPATSSEARRRPHRWESFSWRRVVVTMAALPFVGLLAFFVWQPGLEVRDGRHDRGSNGLWLAHGWLGGDDWFLRHGKTNEFARYRDPGMVRALAEKLRRHGITDVFPHLCPATAEGRLPPVDDVQASRFLDLLAGVRVIPWVGGPNGPNVRAQDPAWRAVFCGDIARLLARHPRLAGVQLNVEPMRSGDEAFLRLLEDVRAVLPPGKLLSVAAYPPPTWWHPFPDVHWDEAYFRAVARRCDQLAVMLYDAGQDVPKTYELLMRDWTAEVLAWSEGRAVLLGVPAYDDAGVGYHDPRVENLTHALRGIHRALARGPLPPHYQGLAIYSDWEMTDDEWRLWREQFLALVPAGIRP